MKSTKKVTRREGLVQLLTLQRDGCREAWAVSYPHKVGNEESSLRVTQQFVLEDEAVHEFRRYADFFSKRDKCDAKHGILHCSLPKNHTGDHLGYDLSGKPRVWKGK